MIKIGIVGDIGSGKSYVAKVFGYPVFNADYEVSKLYKKDIKVFRKIKKVLPKFFSVFPVKTKLSPSIILPNPLSGSAEVKVSIIFLGETLSVDNLCSDKYLILPILG